MLIMVRMIKIFFITLSFTEKTQRTTETKDQNTFSLY